MEVRGFLKDTTKSSTEILEEIHEDYRAQTAGEDICVVPRGAAANITLAGRSMVDKSKTLKEAGVERNWKYAPFLDNFSKLIPTEFYSQIERWYSVLRKPVSSYMTTNREFVTTFNFNYDLRSPHNQRGGGIAYDNVSARGCGVNWRDDWNNQNPGKNWQNERNDHNLGQYQVNRRYFDCNGRLYNTGGHNLGGRTYNTSSCRANLKNRPPSRDRSGDDQKFQNFAS